MTTWSDYVHYDCQDCGEICINHEESDPTQQDKCHSCHIDDLVEDYEQQLRNQNSTNTTSDREEGAHAPKRSAGGIRQAVAVAVSNTRILLTLLSKLVYKRIHHRRLSAYQLEQLCKRL